MDTLENPKELAIRIFKVAGGELRFKYKFNTPGEILAGGEHNLAELERLEEMGVSERIWDLMCLLLAEVLPPLVLAEYGDTSTASLRKFLLDKVFKLEPEWERIKKLERAALATVGLTEQQLETIYMLIDALPYLLVEEIVEGVAPLCIVPREESGKFTGILVEMFREVRDVDRNRNN